MGLGCALFMAACSGGGIRPDAEGKGLRMASFPPVPALPEWENNPVSPEKLEIGRAMFFDSRLSGSGTGGCIICHLPPADFQGSTVHDIPDRSYPDTEPTLHRNTPSLLNFVYAPMARWDGSRFTNTFDMMVLPFAESNVNIAGLSPEQPDEVDIPAAQRAMKQKLATDIPGYADLFQQAFGVDINELSPEEVWELAGKALAVYALVAVSRDAPFDRWNAGEDGAIGDAAIRGAELFVEVGCLRCHNGPFLSDFDFHNISTSVPDDSGVRPDEGRFLVTGDPRDRGAFLTPMLRSVSRTGPYFHDGSFGSLIQVIRHKTTAASRNDPLHDPKLDGSRELSGRELEDLLAFLRSLNGALIPAEDLSPPAEFPN